MAAPVNRYAPLLNPKYAFAPLLLASFIAIGNHAFARDVVREYYVNQILKKCCVPPAGKKFLLFKEPINVSVVNASGMTEAQTEEIAGNIYDFANKTGIDVRFDRNMSARNEPVMSGATASIIIIALPALKQDIEMKTIKQAEVIYNELLSGLPSKTSFDEIINTVYDKEKIFFNSSVTASDRRLRSIFTTRFNLHNERAAQFCEAAIMSSLGYNPSGILIDNTIFGLSNTEMKITEYDVGILKALYADKSGRRDIELRDVAKRLE